MKSSELIKSLMIALESGKYGVPGSRFPTTRELAATCEVSLESASSAMRTLAAQGYITLSGKRYYVTCGYVSPSTPYGRILRRDRRPILALEIKNLNNPFFSALAQNLSIQARRHGYSLMICSSGSNFEAERENMRLFTELNVSGVFTCPDTQGDVVSLYGKSILPIVVLGRNLGLPNCDTVIVDNSSAGAQVASHLAAMGCKSFAYLGIRDYIDRDQRLSGFSDQLHALGRQLDHLITVSAADDESLSARLSALISGAEKPLGLFCYHDLLAVEATRVIMTRHGNHFRIPEDICVVGFDDLPIASAVTPKLTTVSYRYSSIAELAVERMISYIDDPSHTVSEVTVPSVLMIRKSSTRLCRQ